MFLVFSTRTQDTRNLIAGLTAVAETPKVERLDTADSGAFGHDRQWSVWTRQTVERLDMTDSGAFGYGRQWSVWT